MSEETFTTCSTVSGPVTVYFLNLYHPWLYLKFNIPFPEQNAAITITFDMYQYIALIISPALKT